MTPHESVDALLPAEMAEKAETIGVAKAALPTLKMLALGVLAGAFIALGAVFATVVWTGSEQLPWGIARLLGGVVFSLGLILVIVGGAELFTGNNLIAMAWASRQIGIGQLLRNWFVVYTGNFIGSVGTAILIVLSGHLDHAQGAVGAKAMAIANAKCQIPFIQAVFLGILCNTLVCLAVWLTLSARSTVDRILAIIFPITAFVAAGFEHCVANMYFVPVALLYKMSGAENAQTWLADRPDSAAALNWADFLLANLIPVTIGNIIGGTLLVAGVYWVIYLRPRNSSQPSSP